MKRTADILLAGAGLALLWPLMLLVAIAIRLDSRGPALFRQERVGRFLRPFRIYKFRTMALGADRIGPGITARGDRRVTRVGAFLRATKLDELPQLLNVLWGDMSLVGPRPELPRYVQRYRDDFREILHARPGITDLASILYRRLRLSGIRVTRGTARELMRGGAPMVTMSLAIAVQPLMLLARRRI